MKQLIWKELREQRFIPVAMGAMMIVGLAVWYVASAWLAAHHEGTVLKFEETGMALVIGLYLPGLFAGSGAIAPETGSGTIEFLSTLPTGRRRIWVAKVVAGVGITVVSMVSVLIGYLVAVMLLYGPGFVTHAVHLIAHPTQDEAQLLGSAVFFCLYGYSVCLFISTLVDRTVVAISVGLICSLLCYVSFGGYMAELQIPSRNSWGGMDIVIGLTIALSVAFSAGSMAAFAGPSAGRSKRAWAVLMAGIVAVGIGLTLVASAAKSAFADDQARHVIMASVPQLSPADMRYWDTATFRIVFPAAGASTTSCYYDLEGPGGYVMSELGSKIARNDASKEPFRQPASTRDSSRYVISHLTRPNHIVITLSRYLSPSVHHDSVAILAADGTQVGEIDIDNITR